MSQTSTPATRAGALPRLRLEHLWAIFGVSLITAFISLTPTAPHDYWWHLKAGELVASGTIPTTNRFAWTLQAEHPFVYQSWLGELLFYWIYTLGGHPLVVFTRNLLGGVAYTMVAFEAHRRSGSWRLAAAATVFAALMTINNFTTRTQNWSWVPFMLVVSLLGRYADRQLGARWLAALPVVMVFWVNVHGAFILGLLVAGAFVTGETLRRLLKQPGALYWDELRPLFLALLGMALALLVNPLGPGVIGYLRTLLTDQSSQQLINEWQTPDPRNFAGGAFYLGVLALLAAFAFQRRRPTLTEVILVCGLAWQAFIGVRYVVWFGMVAMPIAAQSLAAARGALGGAPPPGSGRERGGGTAANLVAAGLLALLVLLAQPWVKPALPLPQAYRDFFAPVPGAPMLFSRDTPASAVAHLRAEPCQGRLFNEMGYGSYLAWALYPEAQSFVDPRVELFPYALWQEYIAISRGQGLAEAFARREIACVLLDRDAQPQLATAMAALPGWRRSYADAQSEVWRRTGP